MKTHLCLSCYTRTERNHTSSFLLFLCMFCGLLVFALVGQSAKVFASGMPGGNVTDPVVRAVDIAEPAVVRIFTTGSGHLAVQLPGGTVSFPQQGAGYQMTFSGSGTFITSHGDILTADHVINPPVQDAGVAQAFDDSAAQDVAQYINQHHLATSQVTPTQVDQELRSGQLAATPNFDSLTSVVFLSTSYSGPLTATTLQDVPNGLFVTVDKIEMQSSFNQTDVAIIHVPLTDTPSVPLGDSSNVQQQDTLTIIGFPGNGDVSQRPTDLLTSSVNQAFVSSIKTTDTGAPVIQVGGNVEHGDSGGPALNSSGDVVGIVSFGLVSSDGSSGGTSFLQTSNSAQSLLHSLKLNTTPGAFERGWKQAFDDYASTAPGHWHKAAREFQQLVVSYPLFKAVTPYLNYTKAQAATETSTNNSTAQTQAHPASATGFTLASIKALAITIGGVLILLLLIVVLVRLAWRRNRRDKRSQQPASTASPQASKVNVPTTLHGQVPLLPVTGPQVAQLPIQPRQSSADSLLDGMSAFGAPTAPAAPLKAGQQSQPVASAGGTPSSVLRAWPCGHMNRSNARFCSVCGEPAPIQPPSTRQIEQ